MTETRHALVVDDHPTNRLLAMAMLRKLGWQVTEAASGEEALEKCKDKEFRLVLLDISMPGLSGQETCARLRKMPDSSKILIIAYTAHAFQEDLDNLLAEGFDHVLVKPVSHQRLEALISDLQ